jgi:hypothetical protein
MGLVVCLFSKMYDLASHGAQDLAALNLSPALPMVRMALSASALVCNLGANVFSMFGIWKVPEATQPPTKDRQNNDQNVNSKN